MTSERDRTHHIMLLDGTTLSASGPKKSHLFRLKAGFIEDNNSRSDNQCRQMAYYEPGIASGSGLLNGIDSAFAFGFDRYVIERLKYLSSVYQKDDYITIIGYSRGAAAAMLIARYITLIGLPFPTDGDDTLLKQVKSLIKKGGRNSTKFDVIKQNRFQVRNQHVTVARLILLHVQSTFLVMIIIHAYLSSDPVATTPTLRHDTVTFEMSDAGQVICCYAADENCLGFAPVQFTPTLAQNAAAQQVNAHLAVFCGSHSDIGGTSSSSLRWIPLRYAIIKAQSITPRLRFKDEFLKDHFLDPSDLSIPSIVPFFQETDGEKVDYTRCRGGNSHLLLRADQLDSKCNITKPRDLKWKML
ncbi:hypothetical protein ACEPAF_499 [Sanghuangporus sanghuang]